MVRVVVLFLFCFSVSGCGDVYRYLTSGQVGWAINKEIRSKGRTEIALSEITNFKWDELVIFGAYTPQIEICKRLQLSQEVCKAKIPAEPNDDGEILLVFRLSKDVVHAEIHIGWHGDFDMDGTTTLTPQSAVFAVEKKGKLYSGEDNLALRLKARNHSQVLDIVSWKSLFS